MPIGEAFDGHLAKYGGQRPAMAGFGAPVADTTGIDHVCSLLLSSSKVQMVLEKPEQ
jgi:hypothetical protein